MDTSGRGLGCCLCPRFRFCLWWRVGVVRVDGVVGGDKGSGRC